MKRTIFVVSSIWIILVGTSFVWNYLNANKEQKTLAFQTARSFFYQILISRSWNAMHGGVYVPVTKDTQPNPYLNDPLRDIEGIQHEKASPAGIVSVSLGVATAENNLSTSYEDLIRQSDKALYLAKEKGRDRVEAYTESGLVRQTR